MDIQSHRIQLPLVTPIDFLTCGDLEQAQRVYLLLHGFNERAKNAVKRFSEALPKEACFLAPDAPYPLPEKREGYWRIGHAWYFYDSFKEEYFITPIVSAQILASLLSKFCPKAKVSVIGFSQGAYLAPYLPIETSQCDQVVLVNGLVRSDMVSAVKNVQYDIINATEDPYVDFGKSKRHYEAFATHSSEVNFHEIPCDSHEVVPDHLQLLRRILK